MITRLVVLTVLDTNSPWYMIWKEGFLTVRMDGTYTAEELRAIADKMDDEVMDPIDRLSDLDE